MVLLYNFQMSKIGINHMLNSFMSQTQGFDSYYVCTANDKLHQVTRTVDNVFDDLLFNNNN